MVKTKCKLNNTKLFLKLFHIQSKEIGSQSNGSIGHPLGFVIDRLNTSAAQPRYIARIALCLIWTCKQQSADALIRESSSDYANKPANNFCLWAGHLSDQRPVLTGQEASLLGQKCKSVWRNYIPIRESDLLTHLDSGISILLIGIQMTND